MQLRAYSCQPTNYSIVLREEKPTSGLKEKSQKCTFKMSVFEICII